MITTMQTTESYKPNIKMEKCERQVLASILFDDDIKAYALDNVVETRLFLTKPYHKVMEIFNQLADRLIEPNLELIMSEITTETPEKEGKWRKFFEDLKKEVVDKETFLTYLELLQKQLKIKKYYEFADNLKRIVESEKISPLSKDFDEMDKEIDYEYSKIMESLTQSDKIEMSMAEGIAYQMDEMESSLHTESKSVVNAGYEEINEAYNGGHLRGTFNIVAARPAMGKTVYLLNESIEASRRGVKTVFISIEMTMIQCFQRIVAKISGISTNKLQEPKKMKTEDWLKLKEAATEVIDVFDGKFWVIEVSEMNVPRLSRIVREYKKKYDVDTFYLDYLQIMSTDDGKTPQKESEYSSISQGLRKLAKREDIVIVAGSQLNREVEKMENKRPNMGHLRNSGTFEQDAARIVGLYRDEVYNPETDEPNTLEYIILKNRFGKTGTIKFKYDLEKQDIIPMAG